VKDDTFKKHDDQVLLMERSMSSYMRGPNLSLNCQYVFDFEFKILTAVLTDRNKEAQVIPFSQLDPGMLEKMRDKLVELGGKPDPLTGDVLAKIRIVPPQPRPGAAP